MPSALSFLATPRACVTPACNLDPMKIPNLESIDMTKSAVVAPAILRQHPGLNDGQLELIGHLEGPTRGVAGPRHGQNFGGSAQERTNILLLGQG